MDRKRRHARPRRPIPDPIVLSKPTMPANQKLVLPEGGVIVLADKAKGWTSFDVVAKMRGVFRTKRIGHAGTLDPMATGLLLLCVGRATKVVEKLMGQTKVYLATITLGEITKSYDAETEVEESREVPALSVEDVREAAKAFTGPIQQIPPMFSARKVEGKRLYKLARKGITVEREPKEVEVYRFEILSVELPHIVARIECSKGTYVRSLAHDLGLALGCGGHLSKLRREKIGDFDAEDAMTVEELDRLEVFLPQEIQAAHWD